MCWDHEKRYRQSMRTGVGLCPKMLVPRAKPALRPRNKRFLRAEKGMPESLRERDRVRMCVRETSREQRVACASRPPLARYQIRPRLAGVRGTGVRVPWTRDVPSSLTKVAYRKRGTDSRAGHLPRLLSPREGLGSADCRPSRREPRPGVRLGRTLWLSLIHI